ncbi:hypothetical protein CTAYLR_009034 [Chrysophaeum taylorii]|uniref:Amino acid transporter n=1 Tax=Chrysophaeum taylorii TaxID=2483200 RepID=A0AAD7UEI1_9STRA|nr:hypothetical protein CTAYLR_009034 [Chrysophaeum taylorii]
MEVESKEDGKVRAACVPILEEEDDTDFLRKRESRKLGLREALGLNFLNMFGTGPLITLPLLLRATRPHGPHALIGYACAGFVATCDSLVWAELGARFPISGGSQTYLKETLGPLAAFVFVWQFILAGPLEVASGFAAMANYVSYVVHLERVETGVLACIACALAALLAHRELARTTLVASAISLLAIAFILVSGFANFRHFESANGWTGRGSSFSTDRLFAPTGLLFSLGRTMRIGIYDYTGYFDVNFVGDQLENPRRTIPVACIGSCVATGIVYFLVYVAIVGVLPWDGDDGFVKRCSDRDQCYVAALFAERIVGQNFARAFALVVSLTIFGSCFALLVGYATVPYAASRDSLFFSWFSANATTDRSLCVVGTIACALCFVDLDVLVEAVATTRLVAQFAAQAFGLWLLKSRPETRPSSSFNLPLHPIPQLVVILAFAFVFATSPNYIFHRRVPLLEASLVVLLTGVAAYYATARWHANLSAGKNTTNLRVVDHHQV